MKLENQLLFMMYTWGFNRFWDILVSKVFSGRCCCYEQFLCSHQDIDFVGLFRVKIKRSNVNSKINDVPLIWDYFFRCPDVISYWLRCCCGSCYEDVICQRHNIMTRGVDLNSFPWWKPSLTVQLIEGSDGCCVQRNDVMSRLEVVLDPCIVSAKVGFDRMKWGQG